MHGQEIGRVVELADQSQLALDQNAVTLGYHNWEATAKTQALEAGQAILRPLARAFLRVLITELVQREGACFGNGYGVFQRLRVSCIETPELLRPAQAPLSIGERAMAKLLDRAALANA